jgi:hypothetical protein
MSEKGRSNLRTSEKIVVMQAFLDGKKIRCREKGCTNVWELCPIPQWNWAHFDYEIAPVKMDLIETDDGWYASKELVRREMKRIMDLQSCCEHTTARFKKLFLTLFAEEL